MSLVHFRSSSLSNGLLKRSLWSSIRLGLCHSHADDVTKFGAGILRSMQQRNYHRKFWYCIQFTPLHSHCHYSNSVLTKGVNINRLCYPALSQQHPACIAEYSTSSDLKPPSSPPDKPPTEEETKKAEGADVAEPEKLSIYQRFKRTYKEHGKILIAVHVATSIIWYGSFYMAARSGIDIVPYLERWNFSEKIINPFRAGGLGDYALAYLMYKLATPARYTVTIGGTNMVIRILRSRGRMPAVSEEDSIRELVRQGRKQLDSNIRRERRKRAKLFTERGRKQKLK